MTRSILAVATAIVLAACAVPSPSPSAPASSAPPPSAGLAGTPLVPPSPEFPSPTGCPTFPDATGPWPSDRLVDVHVGPGSAGDEIVAFRFGEPSAAGAWSDVSIRLVDPPFAMGGSGEVVDVEGSRFVELRVEGAVVADETGEPTYAGPTRIMPTDLSRIRDAVQLEAFEGVVTWVIGTDFTCLALATSPADGTITLSASLAVP